MRHDPHLDLAVVDGHQLAVAHADHESVADLPPGLGTHRDVLQIRFGRGQPTGRRDGLVERGVNTPVGRNRFEQTVDSHLQPGDITVREQMLQKRMPGLIEQRLQGVRVGGVTGLCLLGLGHTQLVEQHHLQLLGRAQVDLLTDHGVRGIRSLADAGGELILQRRQMIGVDRDTDGFQTGKHPLNRQLHVGEQPRRFDAFELDIERVGQIDHRTGAQHLGLSCLRIARAVLVQ
ncbi:Uncharacterised protein [Mycobacteroides abscessus subsp. abscessus]|nr:Uncharacterised protein [Mycobacteroides abscessus subsp. abscessus]